MTDREELKMLAEAADKDGQHIYTNPRDANNWRANDEWHVAARPEIFLFLIAEVEGLRRQVEAEQMYSSLRFDELTALRSSIDAKLERAIRLTLADCRRYIVVDHASTEWMVAAVLEKMKGEKNG